MFSISEFHGAGSAKKARACHLKNYQLVSGIWRESFGGKFCSVGKMNDVYTRSVFQSDP